MKDVDEILRQQAHDLRERVKELNCLYGISELAGRPDISLAEMLQGVVDLIPPSWQYPEVTAARIRIEDQVFETNNFQETLWKQHCDIFSHGRLIGGLDVCYLKEKPESDEGPFLKEERLLIEAIAERLGKIVERYQAKEELRASEARYSTLIESVNDGVILFRDGKILFANYAFASLFGFRNPDQVIGLAVLESVSEDFRERFQEMHEKLEAGLPLGITFQVGCLAQGGREIWVEWRSTAIKWKGRPTFLSTVRDITEFKLREMTIMEETRQLQRENVRLKADIKDRYRLGGIIGKSPAMQEVYDLILRAAKTEAYVIITGESGTGKELVARAIHDLSARHEKAFVPVNCGAIPETLFENEFFGHTKGAFTGAHVDKHGYLRLADRGTLFLDEVAELTPAMQAKLLRALEGAGFAPVGSGAIRISDVRIISATNKDLGAQVSKGLMREDFFYRIQVVPIRIPPLRDRREDVPLLVDHFFKSFTKDKGRPDMPEKIKAALYSYDWPGNVRELQNVLQRYLTVNRLDFTGADVLSGRVVAPEYQGAVPPEGLDLYTARKDFEKDIILKALEKTRWSRGKAASVLGIDRRTLLRKMKKLGLS